MFHVPEQFRFIGGPLGSDASFGNNGVFSVPFESFELMIIASDGAGWEHVSVSHKNRCPNWKEMCFVKELFWDAEDCVVQYHPPKSDYINRHPNCLHLWRPIGVTLPRPTKNLVG